MTVIAMIIISTVLDLSSSLDFRLLVVISLDLVWAIRCLHDDAFLARNPRPDMAPKWGPRELYLKIVAD